MCLPGRRDVVTELTDVPQSSVGAPLPVVLAGEHGLQLVYLAEDGDPEWDGTSVRTLDDTSAVPVVVVTFEGPYAHRFGPPNDEALAGHPLAARGLEPYAAFRVDRSSWIAGLERMNRVHEHHDRRGFDALSHFIFVFHDSTFECAARAFTAERRDGPQRAVLAALAADGLG